MWQLPPITPEEILIYSRKSQTDDPILTVEETLAKHEQRLDEWVARNLPGMGEVPEKNRHREVVSGETLENRPRVREMLRRIESPEVKAVLCIEPQRLSRGSLEDIGRLVKLLRFSNTIVITMQYTYDLRDDRDRELFERELMRGNEYLEYYKRIQQAGRLQSCRAGNYLGTRPPYGFKKIHYKEGKVDCYSLEPIPEQARIVKLIFEMYRDGYGSHKIARRLNEMGVKTQRGNKWSAESLKKMRTNEHYIGKVVWNKRKNTRTVENGEVILSRPLQNDYLVFPGKHPAIIDQDLWDAVQEIRDKIPPVKNKAKCVNPFAGLVTCQCGYGMSMRTYKNKEGKERNPPRLLCTNQAECGTASCYVSEMTDAVVRVLRDAIADFDLQVEASSSDAAELHRQLIAQQEKRLEDLNRLELSQWDKYTKEEMPKHIFDQLNAKVLEEKAEVQQALCLMRDSLPEPVDYEKKRTLFSDALRALQDPDAPALEKNMLLKQCIDRIDYNRKKKGSGNRRWGDPEPMELDVHLRV
jgi:DNA invertase Pin-like site-specific DNA recombinase